MNRNTPSNDCERHPTPSSGLQSARGSVLYTAQIVSGEGRGMPKMSFRPCPGGRIPLARSQANRTDQTRRSGHGATNDPPRVGRTHRRKPRAAVGQPKRSRTGELLSSHPRTRHPHPRQQTRLPPRVESARGNLRLQLIHLPDRPHLEVDPLILLHVGDDIKEVAGLWIARRPEHTHQALGRLVRQ